MRRFKYPTPMVTPEWELTPGGTIGEMVRLALETGVTPDMPAPELGDDSDDSTFDSFDHPRDGHPYVDPLGDVRSDWFDLAEKGFPVNPPSGPSVPDSDPAPVEAPSTDE